MKNIFRNNRGSLLASGGTAIIVFVVTLAMSLSASGYNDIYEDANYNIEIANARMIVSATAAHNALAEANSENDRIITYDMLMTYATIEEYNNASDIEIYSLNNDDFNLAKEYIYEDNNGGLVVIEIETSVIVENENSELAEPSYPERPINIIVPFGAGGGTDGWNRAIAAALAENGWDIKVSNITGGSAGSVGTMQVWNSAHDGYTLAGTSETCLCIPVMAGSMQTTKDWEYYIAAGSPGVLCVNADTGIEDIQALIDACSEGEVNIASTAGGLWFLLASMVEYATDIELNVATYNGSASSIAACVSGETAAVAASAGEVSEYVKDGSLIPIAAYQTTDFVHDDFGRVPAITDTIPELERYLPLNQFIGFMVPDDTPEDIKAALEEAFLEACESETLKIFADLNYSVLYKLVGKEADAHVAKAQSVMSWMLYDMGKTEYMPEEFGIPHP